MPGRFSVGYGFRACFPLASERGLTRHDAYILVSLAVDLAVVLATQLVDGTKGVHAKLPKAIFRR